MSEKTCWVVTEGKAGMENQALGLAEAIGYPVSVKRLNVRQPWRSLPSALWFRPFSALASSGDTLEPPWPDLLIGCGRLSIPLSIAVRRASGGKPYTVQMQHPRVALSNFDLVVPPRPAPQLGLGPFAATIRSMPTRVSRRRKAVCSSEGLRLLEIIADQQKLISAARGLVRLMRERC